MLQLVVKHHISFRQLLTNYSVLAYQKKTNYTVLLKTTGANTDRASSMQQYRRPFQAK